MVVGPMIPILCMCVTNAVLPAEEAHIASKFEPPSTTLTQRPLRNKHLSPRAEYGKHRRREQHADSGRDRYSDCLRIVAK